MAIKAGYIGGYTEEYSFKKSTLFQLDSGNCDSVSGHHFSSGLVLCRPRSFADHLERSEDQALYVYWRSALFAAVRENPASLGTLRIRRWAQ